MSMNGEELYRLLPALHRLRDAGSGAPLHALLEVLAGQGRLVEDDVGQLYEDWFIETCAEWVVPYIGDLLGVRGLRELGEDAPYSRRALVANTIGYRRRKGTVPVLEQLAYDTTGWPAKAVEYFSRLGWTQHLNFTRPEALRTPDLRHAAVLELIDGPFDPAARSVDVRRIAAERGRYNLPHLAVFAWRLAAYRLINAEPAAGPLADTYLCDPLGRHQHCYNPPRTETDLAQSTGEEHVPAPLRRLPLHAELEARREALAAGAAPHYVWFDDRANARATPALLLRLDGDPVPADQLMICDLSTWHHPPDSLDYQIIQPDGTSTVVARPISAAIDPVLGRISLSPARAGASVRIDWSYGFPGDLGGGPYDRRRSMERALNRPVEWQLGVSRVHPAAGEIVDTLQAAIAQWNAQPDGTVGLITLMDTSTWPESLTGAQGIRVGPGSRLTIAAAEWPLLGVPDGLPGQTQRALGRIDPTLRRPHLRTDIDVRGSAAPEDESGGELMLDGLLIEGRVRIEDGNLNRLRIAHCTLVPGAGGLLVEGENRHLAIELERSICGGLDVTPALGRISIEQSIVQAVPLAVNAPASGVAVCASTIDGACEVERFSAENSIFLAPLQVARRQEGCVRYCYLAPGSSVPTAFRCQPELAVSAAPTGSDANSIRARLRPTFTTLEYGRPGYAQLGRGCATEITTGAEDGNEMGVWGFLRQAHRLANYRSQLDDYLRFGMEAGVVFVT